MELSESAHNGILSWCLAKVIKLDRKNNTRLPPNIANTRTLTYT